MYLRTSYCLGLVMLAAALVPTAGAAVIYNESVSGDLSNDRLAPTILNVVLGSNQIFGVTGRDATGIDRDYFQFTVPVGLELSSFTLLPGTTVGAISGFVGIGAGPQITVLPTAASAAGLLGWTHYIPRQINTNILPDMGVSAAGSTGFRGSLPAGTYSFWVQEFNQGPLLYGFDAALTQTPEPSTWSVLSGAAVVLAGLARVKRSTRKSRT